MNMDYDTFFREATQRGMRLSSVRATQGFPASLNNEALFQLPLLAMVILMLAKGNSKPAPSQLGQLVGECLQRTVAGFKGSSQDIGWSANLRIRTIKALTFLERTGLVLVEPEAAVSATPRGREVLRHVLDEEASMLAEAMLVIERSYENIRAERRIRAEV
jgi:hypothetical protein